MALEVFSDRSIKAIDQAVTKKDVKKLVQNKAEESAVVTNKDYSVNIADAERLDKAKKIAINSDGIDQDKVNAFRQRLASGNYKVDANQLAQKIIDAESEFAFIFS